MKRYSLVAALAMIACTQASALSGDKDSVISMTASELGKLYKTVSYNRISVHDPSIVKSGGKYYIYGSHRAAAVTSDLQNWNWQNWTYGIPQSDGKVTATEGFEGVFNTSMTTTVKVLQGTDAVDVAFGNFDAEAWRYTENNPSLGGNQWAPDIIWNPHMKKWCLYMSLNGDDWRSSIVLLTSSSITGPFVYQGPVVVSGFQWNGTDYKKTDLELAIGEQASLPSRYALGKGWGSRWPNCIDPCVFFDEEGELWMSYGSWSGGIFILKLDKDNGLRDYTHTYPDVSASTDAVSSDPYFGKKIAGGYYVSGEGSYIEHIGDYYYLFVTNGGLNADGGYEMHYFRSATPDGTYVDGSGNNARYSSYQMNYGPNATTTRGMKLLGSYQWENMSLCELSQGHNSMLLDDDGRAYIVYHTRFNGGNEGHEVRVHQLFLNNKGWLVASPFEFNGLKGNHSQYRQSDIDSTELCTTNDIVGTYRVMLHPYKVDYANFAYSSPQTVELRANGLISGDYYGRWSVKEGTSFITLRVRGKGESVYTEYYGVVLPQVVTGTNMPSVCFTATASSGVSLWGCNVDGNYAVDLTYSNFTIPVKARQYITEDVDLQSNVGSWGAVISWKSSHPELLSDDGKLQVPYCADGDSTTIVGLTYTIQKDNYAYSYTRNVRVRTNKSLICGKEDVNMDGTVDTQDVLNVYEYMKDNTSSDDSPVQDVNGDGLVDEKDVQAIYEYMKEK